MEKGSSLERDRAATDATLDAERASVDGSAERRLSRARRLRDDLIERDRMNADQQLSKYRESVGSILARERLAKKADANVEEERRAVERERANIEARRKVTDEQLAIERSDADTAVVRRTEILSMVTHDLRSPLCVILLNAQAVAAQTNDEPTQEILDDIVLAAARMERLLSDLLDVARVESEVLAVHMREHDVGTLLGEVVRTYRPLFADRRMSFHGEALDQPCVATFDHDRIVQVLSNLLGNAMKFAPEGGSVTLGVEVRTQELQFFVRDDGPGIPLDALTRVFERFWRTDGEDRRGLGLGLYISEKLVAAHGGRIWVESEPGRGATFRFTLPY